jgi:ribosomal protein S18 acetylase RimI-like enzyme
MGKTFPMTEKMERAITGTVDWVAPNGLTVRGATADDARDIADLWNRANEEQKERRRRLPFADLLDAVYQRLADPEGRFLLAFDGGALVGMVHAAIVERPTLREDIASRQMNLSMLAVDPTSWRRGLGLTLIGRCIELARARRVDAVRLWSHTTSDRASRIYEKLGFRNGHCFKLDMGGEVAVQYRYSVDR